MRRVTRNKKSCISIVSKSRIVHYLMICWSPLCRDQLWGRTSICRSCTARSRAMCFVSCCVSDAGNTANWLSYIVLPDHPDLIKLVVWVTKPSKVNLLINQDYSLDLYKKYLIFRKFFLYKGSQYNNMYMFILASQICIHNKEVLFSVLIYYSMAVMEISSKFVELFLFFRFGHFILHTSYLVRNGSMTW